MHVPDLISFSLARNDRSMRDELSDLTMQLEMSHQLFIIIIHLSNTQDTIKWLMDGMQCIIVELEQIFDDEIATFST